MTQKLVPEAKNGLAKFRNQVAKQCGSVGGEMVKRMVQQYEEGIK